MAKRLVAVSDLHIGRGNNQDDFRDPAGAFRGEAFASFCGAIVQDAGGEALTFVLNGDIIDLWEIARDEELEGEGAVEAIRRNLFYPATTDAAKAAATAYGRWQIDAALAQHPGFVRGVRTLLQQPSVRVVYLFGNHDHAMVNPALQEHLRHWLDADGTVGAADPKRLAFGFWHQDEELHAYLEHGNQFAGEDSRFRNPALWTEQALGYYPLRFAWNRYQHRHNVIAPSTGAKLSVLFSLLTGDPTTAALESLQYLLDYFAAFEDALVPKIVGEFGIGLVHDIWRKRGKPDHADALFHRAVAHDLKASKQAAEDARKAAAALGGMTAAGVELHPDADFDDYTQGLVRRFQHLEPPFPDLDWNRHFKLLLGHTHRPRNQWLYQFDSGVKRQRYINCGTWTRELAFPTFGYVVSPNWKDVRGLQEFR